MIFLNHHDFMVNVMSVSFLFNEIFCTTISTFIELSDNGLNIAAATPGLSLHQNRYFGIILCRRNTSYYLITK